MALDIKGFLFDRFASWLIQKAKDNPQYSKLIGQIGIDSNDIELNQLLELSVMQTKENEIIKALSNQDILDSLKENLDIIFECVIFSRDQITENKCLDRIQYLNDNEIHQKQIKTFYKSLYEQIHKNKINYPTLQNLQIIERVAELKENIRENTAIIRNVASGLDSLLVSVQWDFNDELNIIDQKINDRCFSSAREIAFGIENKIRKNNKNNEIEKLYAMIINSYLLEGNNQEKALGYFDKLIAFTTDDKKINQRKILRYIIQKDIIAAQRELELVFQSNKDIDSDYYIYQLNIFLLSYEFEKAYNFVLENNSHIIDYQYYTELILIQQKRFEEAKDYLDKNKDFFQLDKFEIQKIRIEIEINFLFNKIVFEMSLDDIEKLKSILLDIDKLINRSGEDELIKSYFHTIKALIFSSLNDLSSSVDEYEKAVALDKDNINALKYYPRLLWSIGGEENLKKGFEYIKKYLTKTPDSREDKSVYLLYLSFFYPRKAIQEILEMPEQNVQEQLILVSAYDKIFDINKAEELLQDIITKYGDSPDVFLSAGNHHAINKDYEKSFFNYIKAYTLSVQEIQCEDILRNLFKIAYKTRNENKIIIVKKLIEEKYPLDIILLKYYEEYIYCLLISQEFIKCISCCELLRSAGKNNRYIIETELCCYYNTRNFQKVLVIIDENPSVITGDLYMYYAASCASLGQYDIAWNILKRIKEPNKKTDYLYRSKILYNIKRDTEALELIHQAYLKFPHDREIQEHFIMLVFFYGVPLTTDEIKRSFKECFDFYGNSNYKDKIMKQYTLPANANGKEILAFLSTIAPGDPDLSKRLAFIRNNRLPISLYKLIYKKNIISIHNMASNSLDENIWITFNFGNEISFVDISEIFIDISSLITLEKLGLLNVVKKIYTKIFITQSIIDEILSFDREINRPFNESVIIHHSGMNYSRDNYEKNILEMKRTCENLIAFITHNKQIEIIGSVISEKNTMINSLKEFIGKYREIDHIESDVIYFSYLSDCGAMIESMHLRSFFYILGKSPRCFGIDSLLMYLGKNEIITIEKFFSCISILIENNYKLIPFNEAFIKFLICREGYIITDRNRKIFQTMNREYDFSSIVSVIKGSLSSLWNDPVNSEIKIKWTEYFFNVLSLNFSLSDTVKYEIFVFIGRKIMSNQHMTDFLNYFNKLYGKNI